MFDCDGTLLETESRWTIAEQVLCERWGVPFSMELKYRLLGTHLDVSGAILAEWVGEPQEHAPAMGQALIEAYREAVDIHGVEAMPGALELVSSLVGRVPIAVASNTSLADTLRVLQRSPLPDTDFDSVVCASERITPKPAPDVYLAACDAIGSEPGETVAFEDSPVGAAAATAAGLYVIGIPAITGVLLQTHATINSLAELSADHLLS